MDYVNRMRPWSQPVKLNRPQFSVPAIPFHWRRAVLSAEEETLLQQVRQYRDKGELLPEELQVQIYEAVRVALDAGRIGKVFDLFVRCDILRVGPAIREDPYRFRMAVLRRLGKSTPEQVRMYLLGLKRIHPLAAALIPPGAFEGV